MSYTKSRPLVVSSSGLIAYMRCPKSFEFGYINNWRTRPKDAMQAGTEFHALMKAWMDGVPEDNLIAMSLAGDFPEMFSVFKAFIQHRAGTFPRKDQLIGTEEPIYSQLLSNVWVRTTFDCVWKNDAGWYVDDDYKTTEKHMQSELDHDFQGKFFLCVLARKFDTLKVERRYRKVRRTPPGVPKNATEQKKADAGKPFESWSVDDCYWDHPLRMTKVEMDQKWEEAQYWASKLLRELKDRQKEIPGTFGRVGLNGASPYTCGSCIMKSLCTREFLQGGLSDLDIAQEVLHIEEPAKLPKGLLKR